MLSVWLPPLWWTKEIGSVQQTQNADWQVNEVTIVGECSNIYPIPKLDFYMTNSDQNKFSPNNIHTLSRDKVIRTNKMITKGKML